MFGKTGVISQLEMELDYFGELLSEKDKRLALYEDKETKK